MVPAEPELTRLWFYPVVGGNVSEDDILHILPDGPLFTCLSRLKVLNGFPIRQSLDEREEFLCFSLIHKFSRAKIHSEQDDASDGIPPMIWLF